MKACAKCGCTQQRACIEFAADGHAYPCFWATADVCSACAFEEFTPADESLEVLRAMRVRVSSPSPRALKVPALAGLVVRPRSMKARRR